jgi:hypothetical protein
LLALHGFAYMMGQTIQPKNKKIILNQPVHLQ